MPSPSSAKLQRRYEYLTLIITEYEKGSLNSLNRSGIIGTAFTPIGAMKRIVEYPLELLDRFEDRPPRPPRDEPEEETPPPGDGSIDVNFDTGEFSILGALLGEIGALDGVREDINNYLDECVGCTNRIQFNWQVQPLNFLDSLQDIIARFEQLAVMFDNATDADTVLPQICNFLNEIEFICVADWVILLAGLGSLIRRYTTNAVNIRLDWTVLLGPLLQLITNAMAGLVNNVNLVLLPPLECVRQLLFTAQQGAGVVSRTTANVVNAFGRQEIAGQNFFTQTEVDIEGLTPIPESPDEIENEFPDAVGVRGRTTRFRPDRDAGVGQNVGNLAFTPPEGDSDRFSYFSGFNLRANMTPRDALLDPNWLDASPIQKVWVAIRDVERMIRGLMAKITGAINSLNSLSSDGIALDLSQLGILLFVLDMVSFIRAVIVLVSNNQNVTDWCRFIEENPDVLRDAFPGAEPELDLENQRVLLRRGPEVITHIDTCANKRSAASAKQIESWIQELNGRM